VGLDRREEFVGGLTRRDVPAVTAHVFHSRFGEVAFVSGSFWQHVNPASRGFAALHASARTSL
jgi:hypothetical protein